MESSRQNHPYGQIVMPPDWLMLILCIQIESDDTKAVVMITEQGVHWAKKPGKGQQFEQEKALRTLKG